MKQKIVISAIIFMIGFTIYSIFRDKRENRLLKNYKTTTAIITKMSPSAYKSSASGYFKYVLNGKEYKFSQSGDYYKYMSVGDTVLIKYAIEDHSVARVIDRYYMQKYLKNKDYPQNSKLLKSKSYLQNRKNN